MIKRTFDWQGNYDPRSRNFRAVEGIEEKPLRSKYWRCDTVLDQGSEGACVGFGWSAELAAKPKVYPTDNEFAKILYHRAQQLDEWPGEDYSGTSVLAGVKAVQEHKDEYDRPLVGEYRWAFGVEDILRTVAYKGPVVLGITWYNNMYQPDEENYIHAEGDIVGGHCILLNGVYIVRNDVNGPFDYSNVNKDKSAVKLHNSWGADWGVDGEAWLSVTDLTKLIEDQQGEACIPSRRRA